MMEKYTTTLGSGRALDDGRSHRSHSCSSAQEEEKEEERKGMMAMTRLGPTLTLYEPTETIDAEAMTRRFFAL